jgi:2-methylisocitrate lyase-like PEP mutase family enzyme
VTPRKLERHAAGYNGIPGGRITEEKHEKTTKLRALLRSKTFLHMPAVYDALGARMVQQAGFEAIYTGGYVSGASRAVSEPLLTMTEQIMIAADAAAAVDIPMIVDAGAGFGEPLHTHAHRAGIHPGRHCRGAH